MTRQGKIARLPVAIREELNQRLLNGEPGRTLLPWLNNLDEVRAVLNQLFDGQPVSHSNLSQWRLGGYQEWLTRQEKLEHIQELTRFAAQLTGANDSSLAEGAALLASSRILEWFSAQGAELSLKDLSEAVLIISRLRRTETAAVRAKVDQARLKQKEELIALQRWKAQRETGELYLEWAKNNETLSIAYDNNGSNAEKIERLGRFMFGAAWDIPPRPQKPGSDDPALEQNEPPSQPQAPESKPDLPDPNDPSSKPDDPRSQPPDPPSEPQAPG